MKRAVFYILVSSFIYNSFANVTISKHLEIFSPDALRVNIQNPSCIISKGNTNAKTIIIATYSNTTKEDHKNSQTIIFNNRANIVEEISKRRQLKKKLHFKSRKGVNTYNSLFLQTRFICLKIPP